MSVLRFFACALMVLAFVPHHHADGASDHIDKQCSRCVSLQNSASSLTADRPSLGPLAADFLAPAEAGETPVSSTSILRADPRAPPF